MRFVLLLGIMFSSVAYSQDDHFLGDWEGGGDIISILKEDDQYHIYKYPRCEGQLSNRFLIFHCGEEKFKAKYLEETDQLLIGSEIYVRFHLLPRIIDLTDTKNKDSLLSAVTLLEDLLQKYPHLVKFQLLMGNAKYHLNDSLEEAQYYYQKVLAILPWYYEGNFNMGTVLLEKDRPEESISYFKTALVAKPKATDALYNLAEAYYKTGEADSAIKYYMAVTMNYIDVSRKALNCYKIGLCYGKLKGDLNMAIKFIEQAIELDHTKPEYYEDLGVAYGMNNDFLNALSVFEKGIKFHATYHKLYYNIGITYDKLEQYENAKPYYEKAENLKQELK